MKKLRNADGISILEVMVAMTILAVGILGLAPLVAVSVYSNSFSGSLSQAENVARRELEDLISMDDYGALPLQSVIDSVEGRYTVMLRVDDETTDATVPAGVYRLKVSLQWTDDVNRQRQTQMITYKPKA